MSLKILDAIFKKDLSFFIPKTEKKQFDFKIHASLCIHRQIDAGAVNSLIHLLCWQNPKVQFSNRGGDALIDRSRSIEASNFLDTDADVMLFVDDDIIYKAEDAIKICREAYQRKTIVGGAYILKTEKNSFITSKPLNDDPIYFKEGSAPVEVRYVATGFMAIHRDVLLKMQDTMPLCHPKSLKFYPFFQPFPYQKEDGTWIYLSEDWAFCQRARDLGFKMWIDPSVRLGHAGRYVYTMDDLCREPKQEREVIRYTDYKDSTAK